MAPGKTAKLAVTQICKTCCLVFLSCLAVTAAGQQVLQPTDLITEPEVEEIRRYSVELIIFEYNGNDAGTELFLPDPLPEDMVVETGEVPVYADGAAMNPPGLAPPVPAEGTPEDATETVIPADDPEAPIELTPEEMILGEIPGPAQIHLQIMDPADYVLLDAYDRLLELGAYKPLLHAGWTQDAVEEAETRTIHLRRLGDPPLKLDGVVSLYLSRYLHLVIDLELEDSVATAPPAATTGIGVGIGVDSPDPRDSQYDPYVSPAFAPVHYRILEDRIVRNGELRYYDHPKFGVLAKITRIEEVEALPEEFDAQPGGIASGESQSGF